MAEETRFAVYFSHSWRPHDVDLNLKVWEEFAASCELLVDAPEEPGANPPYYINRIEELLRRTDLFLSVLTHRDPSPGDFTEADAHLHCSPYSLFEIRLAERADIPRFILYERSTGFRPPLTIRPGEAYIPFDRVKRALPEQRQWARVVQGKIQQWINWVEDHRKPSSYELSPLAALLIGQTSAVRADIEKCLRDVGYEIAPLDPERQKSSESLRTLREVGLVVAEFGTADPIRDQLYAAAHGMGLPAIRLLNDDHGVAELPWILRGDPGGYQNDLIRWNTVSDLPAMVTPRARAMFNLSQALRDADGSGYLQSKRYAQFFVFISHNLKPPHRLVIESVYSLLKQRHITPFEYHQVNTAGTDWREHLSEALNKTTHFIALLSPDYEQSPTCVYEMEEMLGRADKVSILPFMIDGRDRPGPKLTQMHNTLLSGEDPDVHARKIVEQVVSALDSALEGQAT